ncbi:TPA: hypothetical protein NI644_001924 [Pseudomonas aeruginosa]|nr:hypothetical protein [Pseudomonas aeruginosa]MBI7359257.1 hypothetical protein [Pseudomonas aeruginosa]MBV6202422.1 hypothetical protein [Pseudomonas aeruginosa]HCE6019379.1 hypothetical protein [Pseudomonas aeruginosa]HCF9264878.1 hypothetical protein [Pseudomonas aeruginosa]
MFMSKHPLSPISVGDETYIVMSRGHHDLTEFMRAATNAYPDWQLGGPAHMWCKTTPCKDGWRYNLVKEGTRGAWPATYCWEYGEDWKRWNGLDTASLEHPAD